MMLVGLLLTTIAVSHTGVLAASRRQILEDSTHNGGNKVCSPTRDNMDGKASDCLLTDGSSLVADNDGFDDATCDLFYYDKTFCEDIANQDYCSEPQNVDVGKFCRRVQQENLPEGAPAVPPHGEPKSPVCRAQHGQAGFVYGICATATNQDSNSHEQDSINCGNQCDNICTAMGIQYVSPNQCSNAGGHGGCESHLPGSAKQHCCKCSPPLCGALEQRNCLGELKPRPFINVLKPKYIQRVCASGNSNNCNTDFGSAKPDKRTAHCIVKNGDVQVEDGDKVHCVAVRKVGDHANEITNGTETIEDITNSMIGAFMVYATAHIEDTDDYKVEITWEEGNGNKKYDCSGQTYTVIGNKTQNCDGWGDPHFFTTRFDETTQTWNEERHNWGGICNPDTYSSSVCDPMPYGLIAQSDETQIVAHFHHVKHRNTATSHIDRLVTTMKSLVINFVNVGYWTLIARDGPDGKPEHPQLVVDYANDTFGQPSSTVEPPFCMRDSTHSNGDKTYWVILPNGDTIQVRSRLSGGNGWVLDIQDINIMGGSTGGVCGGSKETYQATSSYYVGDPFDNNPMVQQHTIWRSNPTYLGNECASEYGSDYEHASITDEGAPDVFRDSLLPSTTNNRRRNAESEHEWLVLGKEHMVKRRQARGPRSAGSCKAELNRIRNSNSLLQFAKDANCNWDVMSESTVFDQLEEDCLTIASTELETTMNREAIQSCYKTMMPGGGAQKELAGDFIKQTVAKTKDLACNDQGTPSPNGCQCKNQRSGPTCRKGQGESIKIVGGHIGHPNRKLAKAAKAYEVQMKQAKQQNNGNNGNNNNNNGNNNGNNGNNNGNNGNNNGNNGNNNGNNGNSRKHTCVTPTSLMKLTLTGTDYGSTCHSVRCNGQPGQGTIVGDSTLLIKAWELKLTPGTDNVPCEAVVDNEVITWAVNTC